ncbi:hypothetical protein [Leptospira bouyouniensis]|uniref:hypothetical protein n=1 Tax=Leptospira bouyouniensis TaxID=2484911 RepID=UPI001FD1B456|nr:hypothetical protein [Leptospira bouyouniensis]
MNLIFSDPTSSVQYEGVNIASMGPAGFSMQEFDWAMLNINEAQDRQEFNLEKKYLEEKNNKLIEEKKPPLYTTLSDSDVEELASNERAKDELIASGTETEASLNGLDPKTIASKLEALNQKQNAENTAAGGATAGSLAFMMLSYLGLGRKENDGGRVETDSEDGLIDAPWDQKLNVLEIDEKINDVLDGKLKVEREILFDDGTRYVKLSDGTLISQNNYLSYMNRHTDAKIYLTSDPNHRDSIYPSDDVRSRETIIDIIDRPAREYYKLTQPQLETYREKISKFEEKVKVSEPPVVLKTDNLLVSEENDLKNLREKRTELIKSFQQKILDDIRKNPTDSPYKESADLAKLRKVFETELARVDKGIKTLNAKADIPFKTPVKSKDIVAEAKSRTNYEKIMGLSKDEALKRHQELTKEKDLKNKADKDLNDQRSSIDGLNKAIKLLDDKLSSSKLSEVEKSRLGADRKNLQETVERARQVYAVKLADQESAYKEAFERKTKESIAILNKIYGDQKKTLESELESIKDSKLKKDIDRVEKIKAEIAQLETNKNAAIDSIDNKYKSSTVIVLDRSQDAKADKDAKFYNPKVLIDQYTQSNLKFINESLYPNGAPEFSTKELPGNPMRQQLVLKDGAGVDSGVIILGTQGVNQHSDYGEK